MFWPFRWKPALRAGEWGERQAEKFLAQKGLKILRRVRFGKRDELDLVARAGNVLVFVEVKTRATEDFGRAISAVDAKKRKALSRAAVHYLRRLNPKPDYFRFDVVEVIGKEQGDPPEIRHIENVFTADARYTLPW